MIINVVIRILAKMTMLKHKQTDQTAKPSGKPIDIDAGYERVMARYPRIMARLGA